MYKKGTISWLEFSDRESLATELAAQLLTQLAAANNHDARARLALSGGSTPLPLFRQLAASDFDWRAVAITLVDERYVELGHELSNHGFLAEHLLSKLDQQPEFQPLVLPGRTARAAADEFNLGDLFAVSADQPQFDAVVLGMGADGHTASFFPDADNIGALLGMDRSARVDTCYSASTQVDRITWLPASLCSTRTLVLHITGQDKRAVFETATEPEACDMVQLCELPIRRMLYQDQVPITVYYAD